VSSRGESLAIFLHTKQVGASLGKWLNCGFTLRLSAGLATDFLRGRRRGSAPARGAARGRRNTGKIEETPLADGANHVLLRNVMGSANLNGTAWPRPNH